jgi:glutamate racemase
MIGIFDSGSGGLTVLHAIRDVLPSSDVLYFGDIKNAPYGGKTHQELSKLTVNSLKLLRKRGATNLVSACNSVSASLALSIFDAFDLTQTQMIEMVGPTASYFKGADARILLCATVATITSGIYQNAFEMLDLNIQTAAIPALAGAIEFGKGKDELRTIITEAFKDINWDSIDVLVLGCTHYPLALEIFKEVVPPQVGIFDPALAVAERVEKKFWPQESGSGATTFLISQDSAPFRDFVKRLFPNTQYTIEVVE